MTVRRLLLLACLLFFPLSASAQAGGQTYIIKKGDTLWGVSERFVTDPLYWPNLWANNPFIGNPHLIYPGQKLAIYDGRIEIVPAPAAAEAAPAPVAEAAVAEPLPEPREAITIKTMGGAEGFVSLEELDSVGILVDTVDNRILMAEGDRVFVQMENPAAVSPGDSFSLFDLDRKVDHPVSGEPLGYQVVTLGTLQISKIDGDIATAVITDSHQEIRRGARLRPHLPPVREVELKKAAGELSGYLVAAKGGQIALGQHDVIYVDLGARDGLEAGNLLYITRPRQATELALQNRSLQLPDILLGSAVVLEAREETATALVLKAAEALYRGDRVLTVTE